MSDVGGAPQLTGRGMLDASVAAREARAAVNNCAALLLTVEGAMLLTAGADKYLERVSA